MEWIVDGVDKLILLMGWIVDWILITGWKVYSVDGVDGRLY